MYIRAVGVGCVCVFIRFGFACKIIHSVFRGSDCSKSAAQKTKSSLVVGEVNKDNKKSPTVVELSFYSKWPVCSSFPLHLLQPDS